MTWLLNTNILVYAMNDQGGVRDRINEAASRGLVVTSVLVVAELRYGVERSARRDANRRRLQEALAALDEIVSVTLAVAERFALLKAELASRGVNKGDVDLLLAATARELDATLVTNDGALLDGTIPDLRVENWLRAGP